MIREDVVGVVGYCGVVPIVQQDTTGGDTVFGEVGDGDSVVCLGAEDIRAFKLNRRVI